MIADKLNIQFIIITHNQKLIEIADKLFTVENRGGVSYVF
jgi:chromosome segregation ATPase